jgi:hypothetical protein
MERVGAGLRGNALYVFWVLSLTALPGCLDGGLLPGAESPGALPANMAPDRSYRPSVGDRAILYGTETDAPWGLVPLLPDITTFDKYERAVASQSSTELTDMEREGVLTRTPNGTRVSVMSLKDRTHVRNRHAAEVRILDGPFKDRTAWTPAPVVTRLIQVQPAE